MATLRKGSKVKRPARASSKPVARRPAREKVKARAAPKKPAPVVIDDALFGPLTEGERADAVRTLLDDERVRPIAKVGRYRVVSVEPLVVKPPYPFAGKRLARVVLYDYAGEHCFDAAVDLEASVVFHLTRSTAQPALSREEEHLALEVATRDERVRELAGGTSPRTVLHYWSRHRTDLAFARRSAAVLFLRADGKPALVAVVSLSDRLVSEVVPAGEW